MFLNCTAGHIDAPCLRSQYVLVECKNKFSDEKNVSILENPEANKSQVNVIFGERGTGKGARKRKKNLGRLGRESIPRCDRSIPSLHSDSPLTVRMRACVKNGTLNLLSLDGTFKFSSSLAMSKKKHTDTDRDDK